MRTGTRWLAMCLSVGLALASSPVRGQETDLAPLPDRPPVLAEWGQPGSGVLPVPGELLSPFTVRAQGGDVPPMEPLLPVSLPLYHDRPELGGFYCAMEFLLFRQSIHVGNQVIARRGFRDADGSITGTPGTWIGSQALALHADDLGPLTYQPGIAFTLGYKFRDASALQLDWWHVTTVRYTGSASSVPLYFRLDPQLADSFITADVFNFPPEYAGPDQDLSIGGPGSTYGIWNAASVMNIKFEQRFDQYDLTYRVPIYQDDCNRWYGMLGARFSWIWERWQWRTVDIDSTGAASEQDQAYYNNIVSNRMYGPDVGCGWERYMGNGFAWSFDLRGALLLDIARERASYELADKSTRAKRSRYEYGLSPQVQGSLNLWWYPIEGIQIRVGYNVLATFNTVAAKEPVAFNFATLDPPWERQFIRFLDGLNIGVGLIW